MASDEQEGMEGLQDDQFSESEMDFDAEDDGIASNDDDDMSIDELNDNSSDLYVGESDDNSDGEYDDGEDNDINSGLGVQKGKSLLRKQKRKQQFLRDAKSQKNNPLVKLNLSQGNEAFVNGRDEDAQKFFSEVIRLDPKNVLAYKSLGDIAYKNNKLKDCCTYWYIAAVNSQWDGELWSLVGELSARIGLKRQAILAYGRAIHANTPDINQLIYERAVLYKETNQFGRALDGFRKLSQTFPHDPYYLKDLAEVYLEDRRINDAINLYMELLYKNMHQPRLAGNKFPKLGWQEVNILIELYTTKRSWRLGLNVFKLAARFIHDRNNEKWWDDADNDAEFDERRFDVLRTLPSLDKSTFAKPYDLPIDLRFKIGQIRLELDQKEEAMIHFNMLLDEDPSDISDLILAAGKCLEQHGYYEDALQFLERAHLDFDEIIVLGTCYLELGQYDEARKTFEAVLEADPDDINIKLSLAEALYHLGETADAKVLLDEVSNARKKISNDNEALEYAADIGESSDSNLLLGRHQLKRTKDKKLTDEERQELEELSKRKVQDTFRRMKRLEGAIFGGESIAIDTWLQLSSRLIEVFTSVPNFFPRDKSKAFKGIVLYRRKNPMELDERIARVYNLYDGIPTTDLTSRLFLTSEKEYRGMKYDEWFMIFVQHALLSAQFKDNLDYAIEVIEISMDVNVFVQDKTKEALLKMTRLILGILKGEFQTAVMNYVRFFLMANQFSPFIYKFFLCCFPSGLAAWEAFSNYNHQKFFLRQLKAFDSVNSNKKISGMATITADVKNCRLGDEHAELLYVYSNLLGGNRSYISPIVYLNRAYNRYSKDPMICLNLGLAHVHRSMQRLSSNRHMQLLQGFSYMMEYRDLRLQNATDYEKQEVEFNMGRLYHMIGLVTEACQHYDKVLSYHETLKDDPDYDLLVEAAYNLALIYNINGNSQLALQLTQNYLTV